MARPLAAWRGVGTRVATLPVALLACGVGLTHEFVFASFLSESLTPRMPGFARTHRVNIVLELGQIILVMMKLAVFALLAQALPPVARLSRLVTLAGLALIA